jgi:hypothetical protein
MVLTALVRRPGRILLAILVASLAGLGFVSSASASPGQVSLNVDVTGAEFACTDGTTYTVVSGTAMFLLHESDDATGGTHVTGTVAPTRVSLVSSSDSGTYRLAGASWFGGNFGAGGQSDFTDTEHFVILGAGGVVANVQIVAHFTQLPDGTVTASFEKNTGTCTPPED